jgi:hypothetical protein
MLKMNGKDHGFKTIGFACTLRKAFEGYPFFEGYPLEDTFFLKDTF